MSFGCSVSDVISLTQIARTVVQNSQRACGEHDELTREVTSLHVVLKWLEHEVAKPESPINRSNDTCREEVEVIAGGCRRVLKILDQILEKYNALTETERSGRKLWQKIKFGNGQMGDLADLRTKIIYYTTALSLFLNMMTIGTMGSVEKQLNDAGGDLKDIKDAVNSITAHLIAKDRSEGSVLTAYPDDDKAVWKEFRRELIEDGFSSSLIGKHKFLIKAYIKELGTRGLLDDPEPQAMTGSSAHNHFFLEGTPTLTALGDAGTAKLEQRCSTTASSFSLRERQSTSPPTDYRIRASNDIDEEVARKDRKMESEEEKLDTTGSKKLRTKPLELEEEMQSTELEDAQDATRQLREERGRERIKEVIEEVEERRRESIKKAKEEEEIREERRREIIKKVMEEVEERRRESVKKAKEEEAIREERRREIIKIVERRIAEIRKAREEEEIRKERLRERIKEVAEEEEGYGERRQRRREERARARERRRLGFGGVSEPECGKGLIYY